MGPTYSRSVHHSAEQHGQGVFSHLPDALALQGNSTKADWSKVHVPPGVHPVSCSSQGDQGGGSGDRDSTWVAAKRVVPLSAVAPSGPARVVARA